MTHTQIKLTKGTIEELTERQNDYLQIISDLENKLGTLKCDSSEDIRRLNTKLDELEFENKILKEKSEKFKNDFEATNLKLERTQEGLSLL